MDIRLAPPHGVAPVQIGMSLGEARHMAATWGEVKVSGPFAHTSSVKVIAVNQDFQVVVHLEGGESVTAVEVWRSAGDADVRVLLGELDVFRTPAREVLRRLAAQGYEIDVSEPEYPTVGGLTLAFTREAAHEVECDPEDGLPLYFESVLVADANYY
ncbi:hypothetical protein [Streptomyces sp. URMC 124]|uniref:hypothetical protein n=1 Tax=Streptomyces sp. URMC 124 TaxID=3423405 RepID=UPI003F1A0F03